MNTKREKGLLIAIDESYCFARMSRTCKWAEIQKGIYDKCEQVHAS